MKRTRLIHLFALYSFSITCCAGNSTSTNKTVIQNDSTPSTLAATKSDKSFSAGAPLASNALKIAAGDTSLALRVNGCSDFIDDISLCNKGSELTIVNSTKKINQTIKLPSLFSRP